MQYLTVKDTTSLSAVGSVQGRTQSTFSSDQNDSPRSMAAVKPPILSNYNENVFDKLFERSDTHQKIVISGHRGGQSNYEPQNTMHAFEAAARQKLRSIEFDVWLTKDEQLVIIHGGDDGELPLALDDKEAGTKYIFDYTLAELQEHHQRTKYYLHAPSRRDAKSLLPTVDELFDFALDCEHQMLLLVEIKSPADPAVRARYNLTLCVEKLHELIYDKQVQDLCLMQSFDHNAVQHFIDINEASGLTRIRTMNLESWEYEYALKTDIENMKVDGIHVQFNPDIITKELVDKLHANGKIISVWFVTGSQNYIEDEQFYKTLAEAGVDMICTDYPAEAQMGTAIPTTSNTISIDKLSTLSSPSK